jgi:hypothetical protein
MMCLVTYFSSRQVKDRVYADIQGVKCKAAQKDGAKGCEVFSYRASGEMSGALRQLPGVYDVDIEEERFGAQVTIRATSLEFIGPMKDFTFGVDGIIRRESAAAGAAKV